MLLTVAAFLSLPIAALSQWQVTKGVIPVPKRSKLLQVVSKFNGTGNFAALKCLSQENRTTPLFARYMVIKPTLYDSIISSIGPVKYGKLSHQGSAYQRIKKKN